MGIFICQLQSSSANYNQVVHLSSLGKESIMLLAAAILVLAVSYASAGCPSDEWKQVGKSRFQGCLLYVKEPMNYNDAVSYCTDNGGETLNVKKSLAILGYSYLAKHGNREKAKEVAQAFQEEGGLAWNGGPDADNENMCLVSTGKLKREHVDCETTLATFTCKAKAQ